MKGMMETLDDLEGRDMAPRKFAATGNRGLRDEIKRVGDMDFRSLFSWAAFTIVGNGCAGKIDMILPR